jgi:hypothetical protein
MTLTTLADVRKLLGHIPKERRELGRATTIGEALQRYEQEAARYPGRLVILRCRIPETLCPMRRSDGRPLNLVI